MTIKEIKDVLFKELDQNLENYRVEEEIEAYKLALGELCKHIGLESIKDLPVGYDRDGSGHSTYSRNGVIVVYYWSKWAGDNPLEIIQVLEEERL